MLVHVDLNEKDRRSTTSRVVKRRSHSAVWTLDDHGICIWNENYPFSNDQSFLMRNWWLKYVCYLFWINTTYLSAIDLAIVFNISRVDWGPLVRATTCKQNAIALRLIYTVSIYNYEQLDCSLIAALLQMRVIGITWLRRRLRISNTFSWFCKEDKKQEKEQLKTTITAEKEDNRCSYEGLTPPRS